MNAIKNFESKLPPKFKNKNIPFTHLTKKYLIRFFVPAQRNFFYSGQIWIVPLIAKFRKKIISLYNNMFANFNEKNRFKSA